MPGRKKIKALKLMKLQLNNLHRQLNKSRTAIQNIPETVIPQSKHKQFQYLQLQLQNCISQLHQQSYKNKILKQLNKILKNDELTYNKITKKQKQIQQQNIQNKIKQHKIEIQKIKQKQNQEINKIIKLKQFINQKRNQRVVYSNLVKKMEKQIKDYEELYKQQLIYRHIMETKINKNAKIMKKQDKNINFAINKNKQLKDKIQNNTLQQIINKNDIQRQSITNNYPTITYHLQSSQKILKNNQKYIIKQPKFHTIRQSKQKQKVYRLSFNSQKIIHTKQLLNKITEFNILIQRIKKNTEDLPTDSLIRYFNDVEDQNIRIFQDIGGIQQKISEIQSQMEMIKNQKQEERFFEDYDLQNQANFLQISGLSFKQSNQAYENQQVSKQSCKIQQIAEILGIQLQISREKIPVIQSLLKLDQKLAILCNQFDIKTPISQKQDNTHSEAIVSCMLSQMQKFTSCEKIFDTALFQAQYLRQLGKRRQIRTRHKIII